MSDGGGKQQNTAYGVFVQACWAQHKRQYPDELIHKEIEEFNKQCSVWWYNLSEQERERFQEMADRSNNTVVATSPGNPGSCGDDVHGARPTSTLELHDAEVSSTIPSFGSSFAYSEYGGGTQIQGGAQVVNAVVDNSGTVINYSTTAGGQQIITQGRVVQRPVSAITTTSSHHHGKAAHQKPMKDPNAPKKPLSAYFLFSQEERLKVKAEYNDYSITEVAKELGRRWATIDPGVKQTYEQRYQESRRQYEVAMSAYKPSKKKKDPNAPKQPLSAYFIFSSEERLKVKAEHPSHSICEVAKELGRRWADMSPEVKQRYQQMAEEGRQKYDINMAAYRQGNYNPPGAGSGETVLGSPDPIASRTVVTTATTVGGVITQNSPATQVVAQSNPGDGSASTQQSAEGRVETVATTAVTTAEATSYSGIETSNDYSSLLQ
ncbi:LOW QUALITY PROTEIN: uncharacterized protein [Lepeophtheirus salmonis]|uniref:LOW QUALITY PROTEIN: uncharacterized protein n=1 Tax=Lepeophtheirus salmonis TaxID=72036 RepID=UPI003AF3619E